MVASMMNIDDSFIEFVTDRLGHDFRYSIHTAEIRALGWEPKIELEKRLLETKTGSLIHMFTCPCLRCQNS